MRKHRFTIVLLTVVGLASGGCASSSSKEASGPPTKRVTTTILQTGSNIGRRLEVPVAESEPTAEEPTKPNKKKPAEVSDEIVTRGGFR